MLDLKTLEVNMRGQAKLTLALVVDGISDKSGMAGAKDDGRLRTASLVIDDSGLIAKLLPATRRRKAPSRKSMVQSALAALAGFSPRRRGRTP